MHQPNQDCFFVGWDFIEVLSQLQLQPATKNVQHKLRLKKNIKQFLQIYKNSIAQIFKNFREEERKNQ